jgi:N-acetylneuraminate synthase/pseudaminic acid synthase
MRMLEKAKTGVYIIAEMSGNHNGEIEMALEIARAAKRAGADCLKTQAYTADSMTIDCESEHFRIKSGLWKGRALYSLYKEASTPHEWQERIKAECGRLGMDFLSTPFDAEGADFLESLGVEAYKVASFELVDIPLIRHIAKKGKPMVVSCGMGSVDEITDALDAMLSEGLGKEKIILMKCVSEYPAPFEGMNLLSIPDMASRFGVTIGLSDHSMGSLAPTVAVALGSRVIEKHFCLSRAMGGVDSAFSMEPGEFSEMARMAGEALKARGCASYGPSEGEKASMAFRRSLFAVRDIEEGEAFTPANIRSIRPGQGIAPKHYESLLGKGSSRSYAAGTPISGAEIRGI